MSERCAHHGCDLEQNHRTKRGLAAQPAIARRSRPLPGRAMQSMIPRGVQPKPALLGLFLRDFQPLPSPNSFYHCPLVVCPQTTRGALMIYVPAAVIKHARDHTIAVSSEIFRQRDNILGQPFFIRQAIWHLALRRTMLAECAANLTAFGSRRTALLFLRCSAPP